MMSFFNYFSMYTHKHVIVLYLCILASFMQTVVEACMFRIIHDIIYIILCLMVFRSCILFLSMCIFVCYFITLSIYIHSLSFSLSLSRTYFLPHFRHDTPFTHTHSRVQTPHAAVSLSLRVLLLSRSDSISGRNRNKVHARVVFVVAHAFHMFFFLA